MCGGASHARAYSVSDSVSNTSTNAGSTNASAYTIASWSNSISYSTSNTIPDAVPNAATAHPASTDTIANAVAYARPVRLVCTRVRRRRQRTLVHVLRVELFELARRLHCR